MKILEYIHAPRQNCPFYSTAQWINHKGNHNHKGKSTKSTLTKYTYNSLHFL